jgi:hypothetical protein
MKVILLQWLMSCIRVSFAVLITIAVAAAFILVPASSAASQIGYLAHSYAGFNAEATGGELTGQKPESKLWFNDGSWWAALLSPAGAGVHDIYKLVSGTWQDTGVTIDPRAATKEDVLSLGSTLYIVSRTGEVAPNTNQLRRYTYSGGTYTLDAGFPVAVGGTGASAVTLARDGTGTLWLAFVKNRKVQVAHTTGSDTSWGAAYQIAGTTLTSTLADIAGVISFTDATGPAVAVMWSDQVTGSFDFAVHRDGAGDASADWSLETALLGPNQADNHVNLKTFEGRVYAVVKTSLANSGDPEIKVLVRSTTGAWTDYPVATVVDGMTRPILLIDESVRQLDVFMTQGQTHPQGIFLKQTSLDAIAFPATPIAVLRGGAGQEINNVTSTKQNLTSAMTPGVVMASDGTNYWWNYGAAPPHVADVARSTLPSTPVSITLSGTDYSACELTFSIVSGPANGSLSPISDAACTPGSPNQDQATLTYTPNAAFTGTDTFTYKANDGTSDSNIGTVTITVPVTNTAPTAANAGRDTAPGTPTTATLSASDPETCELTFSLVSGPSQGSLSPITDAPCSAGAPNRDVAFVTYTPNTAFVGQDTFTYKANDGTADSNVATVTVTVSSGVVGFEGHSYAGFNAEPFNSGAITAQKPESKLWFNDGSWWAAMLSATSQGAHDIFKHVGSGWVDTGVQIDPRASTKEDVLSLGPALYIVSRTGDAVASNQLRRYTYISGTYTLDAGFPVAVAGAGAAAVTLARDGTGTLWLAFVKNRSVQVAHTTGSDTSWGTAYQIPGTTLTSTLRDIAGVISFTDATGPAVGVMWSDQVTGSFDFAVHRDGAADRSIDWTLETAVAGANQADDHVNLKTFQGRIYVAVKTSLTGSGDDLIRLLVRSTGGTWSDYPVATVAESNTRPIVMIDPNRRQLYVLMTLGSTNAHGIAYKQTQLDTISFPPLSTTIVQSASGEPINNVTSMKENISFASGITIMASDGDNYWWNFINTPPNVDDGSTSVNHGSSVQVTLRGLDTESCELTFSIVSGPTHGSLSPITNAPCTPGAPNRDTATVTYTSASTYSGPDSFTFKANDGSLDSNMGTITINVVVPKVTPSSVTTGKGTIISGNATSLASRDGSYLQVRSTTRNSTTEWFGSMFVPANASRLNVFYSGLNSASCSEAINVWKWATSRWITLDSRTVATTEVDIGGLIPPGRPAQYINSGNGEVRVEIRTTCLSPFTTSGDWLYLTY